MGYPANNPSVYLRALAGALSGLGSGAPFDPNSADYAPYARAADAFAQEVDTQFGAGAPTGLELLIIEESSEALWWGRSPLVSDAEVPGAYTLLAQAIVARAIEGNVQAVAEGIDPNAIGGGGGGSVAFSAGTQSSNLSGLTFANSNGVSFGLNAGTLTASVAPAPLGSIVVSAGTSSAHLTSVVFSNSNSLSFGLSGSTITASASFSQSTAPGGIAAGTQTATSGTVVFSNSNGVSFGLSGSSLLTASVATSLTAVNVSAGTTSNNLSALTFSNSNGISFGLNGSVLTASVASTLSVSLFSQDAEFVSNFSISHATLSLQRVSLPANLVATQLAVLMDLEGDSGSSGALTISHAIYTMSNGTASLASSGSGVVSWTSGSATSATSLFGGVSGTRYRSIPVNYSMTPGDYLFGWALSTSNNGSWVIFGRPGVSVVGSLPGLETSCFINGTSVSSITAFPSSIVGTNTNYARTGDGVQRQPGVLLLGTGA